MEDEMSFEFSNYSQLVITFFNVMNDFERKLCWKKLNNGSKNILMGWNDTKVRAIV